MPYFELEVRSLRPFTNHVIITVIIIINSLFQLHYTLRWCYLYSMSWCKWLEWSIKFLNSLSWPKQRLLIRTLLSHVIIVHVHSSACVCPISTRQWNKNNATFSCLYFNIITIFLYKINILHSSVVFIVNCS